MRTLSKFEIENLMKDLKQGHILPINTGNFSSPEQLFLSYNKEGYHVYGELTGLVDITENNVGLNFLEGKYFLGYSRALDMTNTEIKKGDFVFLPNRKLSSSSEKGVLGIVRHIIVEADKLMEKKTGDGSYLSYYKYYNILKPIVVVEVTHEIQRNEYTSATELRHIKPNSIELEVESEEVISKNTRCYYNVKSYSTREEVIV